MDEGFVRTCLAVLTWLIVALFLLAVGFAVARQTKRVKRSALLAVALNLGYPLCFVLVVVGAARGTDASSKAAVLARGISETVNSGVFGALATLATIAVWIVAARREKRALARENPGGVREKSG